MSHSGYTTPMSTIDERKQAWLAHCGLNNSEQDRKLRDRVTALFDIETPTRVQKEILSRADVRTSLHDLPANAYRQQHQEFIGLIKQEILIHRLRKLIWLAPLLVALCAAAVLFAD
jgi:hypothetical protein